MNQYAFNVFLEKSRKNDINEVAPLAAAAARALPTLTRAAAGATRVVGKSATSLRGAAGAAGTAFKKGAVRGMMQGQGVKGSLERGLAGAAQSGVRKIIKNPMVASKVISTGTDFVKTGGFSGQFGREFQQRGAGPNVTYQSALGSLGGGASYQAGKMQTDPLYGLSPAERRRALMQMGPRSTG
jgi:hypothetical protein